MLTLIEIIIGRFVIKKVWVHDVSSEKLEINNKILGLDVHSTRSKGSNLSRFSYTMSKKIMHQVMGFQRKCCIKLLYRWRNRKRMHWVRKECTKWWGLEENFALNYCI